MAGRHGGDDGTASASPGASDDFPRRYATAAPLVLIQIFSGHLMRPPASFPVSRLQAVELHLLFEYSGLCAKPAAFTVGSMPFARFRGSRT